MVCTSQPPKIWWQTSVSSLFNLLSFWIASKQIFLLDWNNFCCKPILSNAMFTFNEKNSGKTIYFASFFFFFKYSPCLLNNPHNKWNHSSFWSVIITILLCHQHRYPWPFLATSPYRSLLPAGPQGYTPYPHRAAVCRFKLVPLLLLSYVKGFIGVHHLWACPYFSSSVLHVWFV